MRELVDPRSAVPPEAVLAAQAPRMRRIAENAEAAAAAGEGERLWRREQLLHALEVTRRRRRRRSITRYA